MIDAQVKCFGCGDPIPDGAGRYHVLSDEQYCSEACIARIAPDVALALQYWRRAYPCATSDIPRSTMHPAGEGFRPMTWH